MAKTKPRFEELTTITLPDVGLRFNAKRIGPMTIGKLRNADYGKRFEMITMPELVPLIYASLKNKEYNTAKNILKTLRKYGVSTNTGILYVSKGMFVQDNPELKNREILMEQKTLERNLERKLGKYEEKGVIFSDDQSVRFTPYNFERGNQTPVELSINKGIIALVAGKENAEKLAEVSEHYYSKPFFQTLIKENFVSPEIRPTSLKLNRFFAHWLNVSASQTEGFGRRCSFGAQEIKKKKKE